MAGAGPPDGPATGGQVNEEPTQLSAVDDADATRRTLEAAMFEMKRVIVGQEQMLERVLVALLAGGHLLIEGVPGLAKTLTVKTLADVLGGSFKRIQFTPDLVPSDLIGTRIYRPNSGTFETELGPVFCNFLLADEINRAPAKVQSALLEVMQEKQVTIGTDTFRVKDPFLVLATQNPIESEGTYPLPEAQLDRFMMKIVVDYPNFGEEMTVVQRSLHESHSVEQVLSAEELLRYQLNVADVYVDHLVREYAVALTMATRDPERYGVEGITGYIAFGASPRGSINLIHSARALALLRGRRYVLPADVRDVAHDVLRHRLVLTYEALAEEVSADRLLEAITSTLPMPSLELSEERTA
jgi:MoxR-like ATPase